MTPPITERWSRPGLVALASVASLLVFGALRCIWESDDWWPLAAGGLIARSVIPQTDPFSWATPGHPWIEPHWGYDLLLHQVVTLFGLGGTVVTKILFLLAAFGLVGARVLTRRNGVLVAGVTFLALLASQQRFFVRPELFTYLLLALQLFLLERDRLRPDRVILLLPLFSILWVNTHALAILGPIVTVAAALSRPRDRRSPLLLGVAGLQFLAGFATPYGLAGFLQPFQLFSEIRGTAFKTAITEFESPWRVTTAFAAVGAYKALAAIPVVVGQLDGAIIPACLMARRGAALETGAPALQVLAGVVLAWSLATNRFYVWTGDTNRFGAHRATHRYPTRVMDRLATLPGTERLFNTVHEGADLLAHGRRVFIDPRLEVQGEAHFARCLREHSSDPLAWALLGSANVTAHDHSRALQALERAVALDLGNGAVRENIARVRAARTAQ